MDVPAAPPPPADERFDALTRLARRHLGAAAALVGLPHGVPRLLSSAGLPPSLAARATACCEAAIFCLDTLYAPVPDRQDPPGLRLLAGYPLRGPHGSRLGALCLLDDGALQLDASQHAFLADLASAAADMLARDRSLASPWRGQEDMPEPARSMSLAIAASGTGVWDRDVTSGQIHYSAGWKALLGYAEHEIGSRIEDSYTRVHPDDLAYVQQTIRDHLEQRTPSYAVEHRLRCKDGSYIWVSSRGKVVSRDAAGRALRMVGTTTDITAMRAMAERLQQTAALLTHLTDEVPGLVFQYHAPPQGPACYPYASAGIEDMYELTAAEVARDDAAVLQRVHAGDRVGFLASMRASAATLEPWQYEYRVVLPRQGLRWRVGAATPRRLADGGTIWHGFITDATARKQTESELQALATQDAVTGLSNRRHFMILGEAERQRIGHGGDGHCAVLMLDLDHFKAINDRWGHAVGDRALAHFGNILRSLLRLGDIAGRIGGEEFAVLLRGGGTELAMVFARRVQLQLAQRPLEDRGLEVAMTVSIGIATLGGTDLSVEAALSRSDRALYEAKARGRNRVVCHA